MLHIKFKGPKRTKFVNDDFSCENYLLKML